MAKILLVDDDRAIHLALKSILQGAGHECVSALDGMQGLMLARQQNPDLIILDINMPAGGGAAIYGRLRILAQTTAIPILIYSVLSRAEVVKKIPEAGSDKVPFLSKPASADAILSAVKDLLAKPRSA